MNIVAQEVYIRPRDAAQRLGLSLKGFYHLLARHQLPESAVTRLGKRVLIKWSEIESFLQRGGKA